MAAFMWNANPKKWNIVPPATSSWEALKNYVLDGSKYVYWSTPVLRKVVKVGDRAFIWRTGFPSGLSGIIAVGYVTESPRPLSVATKALFKLPERLKAAGWSESKAPSLWKTGIRTDRVFWNAPLRVPFTASQGILRRLTDDEVREVESQILVR
jgi:hypothetical protein